jgi:16S rRNA (cytosine1402-N4)-methyltransferase
LPAKILHNDMETRHESVLMEEVIEQLALRPSDVVIDGTLGGAGHFGALMSKLDNTGTLIGIDADHDAILRAENVRAAALEVSPTLTPTIHLVEDNFRNVGSILSALQINKVDKALFDLGWSSFHLESGRGFSFQAHEPLLMTYGDPKEGKTAAELVNSATEQELSDIIFQYGEERFSRGIAKAIVKARKSAPILTTDDLVAIISEGTPSWYQHRRLHPATKTFQALRIAVNDEFGALREGLTATIEHLSEGGRVAVITFHSIEDRIVKSMFRDAAYQGIGVLVTRKPLAPTATEVVHNPRARSAKLRVLERAPYALAAEVAEERTRMGPHVPLISNKRSYDYAA